MTEDSPLTKLMKVNSAERHSEPCGGGWFKWSLGFFYEVLAQGYSPCAQGAENAMDEATAAILESIASELRANVAKRKRLNQCTCQVPGGRVVP